MNNTHIQKHLFLIITIFFFTSIFILGIASGSILFQDSFETDQGWTFYGSLSTWERGVPLIVPGTAHDGTSVIQTNLNGKYNSLEHSWVMSPPMNFRDYRNITLTYWQYREFKSGCKDGVILEVSINGGSTWWQEFPIGGYTETIDSDKNPLGYVQAWCKESHAWEQKTYNLISLNGQSNVRLRFRLGANNHGEKNGFAFDELFITGDYSDITPPLVSISYPLSNTYTNNIITNVIGSINDNDTTISTATLRLNGVPQTINVTNMTFNESVYLSPGENSISVSATDNYGNSGTSPIVTVIVDLTNPIINITSPLNGSIQTDPNQTITGTIDDLSITNATLSINGNPRNITVTNGTFNEPFIIENGVNTIRVTVNDLAENTNFDEITITLDPLLPQIAITNHTTGEWTNSINQTITGTVNDPTVTTVEIFLNTVSIGTVPVVNGLFSSPITFELGSNDLQVTGTNNYGTGISPIITVYVDIVEPNVMIINPTNGLITGNQVIILTGMISDEDSKINIATINTNGTTKDISVTNMTFTSAVILQEGENLIYVTATDKAGNIGTSFTKSIIYDPSLSIIVVNSPIDGETYINPTQTLIGTVSDSTILTLAVNLNGITHNIPISNGNFYDNLVLREGLNNINLTGINSNSQIFTKELQVLLNSGTVGGGGGGGGSGGDGVDVYVAITNPLDNATVNTDKIDINGTVSDLTVTSGTININGIDQYIDVFDGVFGKSIYVNPGVNTITVSATNYSNHTGFDTITLDLNKTTIPRSAFNPIVIDDDFIYAGNSGGQVKIYNKLDYTIFTVLNVCSTPINGIKINDPTIFISCANDRLVYKYSKIFNSNGTLISYPITPPKLVSWNSVSWSPILQDSINTTLTVDILNQSGIPLLTGITNGETIDLNNTSIRLRANFDSTNQFETTELTNWNVNYTIENELFNVSTQTLEFLKPSEICVADIGTPASGERIKVTSSETATETVIK